jgi:hypothetical protein
VQRDLAKRFGAIAVLGILAVGDVALRPALSAKVPHLVLWEFALGLAIVPFLLWIALRPQAKRRPPAPWRRHEQIVRSLPDPVVRGAADPLEAWVERGDAPEAAAAVLARATASDPEARDAAYAAHLERAKTATTRRKREQLIESILKTPGA